MTQSPQQRKAIRKVTELLQAYPLGLVFGEIMEKAVISKTSLNKTLETIGAIQVVGLWHLPANDSGITQDNNGITQDNCVNTQAPQVSYPDNETLAVINPNTGREYVELSETGVTIKEQILNQIMKEETAEKSPAKTYLLIETCHLSLATDTTGEQPVLAKETWFDEEGDKMDDCDSKILNRVCERFSNTVRFNGTDYNRFNWLGKTQILHGIYQRKEYALERMQEICNGKFNENLEVIEV